MGGWLLKWRHVFVFSSFSFHSGREIRTATFHLQNAFCQVKLRKDEMSKNEQAHIGKLLKIGGARRCLGQDAELGRKPDSILRCLTGKEKRQPQGKKMKEQLEKTMDDIKKGHC